MKTSADIRIRGDSTEVSFEWRDFNGDDCFNDFHIIVMTETGTRRFDFGGCAVNGLRQFSRFFRNETPNTVSGGFRNPDIRCYDLYREKDGYRLVVRFEGVGLCEEFTSAIHECRLTTSSCERSIQARPVSRGFE